MPLFTSEQFKCYRDEDGVVHQLVVGYNGTPYVLCQNYGPVHGESKRLTVTCLRCISRPR